MPTSTHPQLTSNAQIVFCRRYPIRSSTPDGTPYTKCPHCYDWHETPEQLFWRVAQVGTTLSQQHHYYELMARLDFLPNSPTLFNANIPDYVGTLSACFKFDVQDSMLGQQCPTCGGPESGSIMGIASKAAAVLKYGGGVGYSLSALRAKGEPIKSTHGKACGPVSAMKHLYHGVSTMITQGGKREGAQMGILHVDHPDIREFIHCKDKDPQALSTFNISVAATDEFMQKVYNAWNVARAGGTSLPEDIIAYALMKEMSDSAWKTGDPGCYFIDTSERTNPTPWLGRLTGTNPCGEVPLLDNEPCNLGSINLTNFVIIEEVDTTHMGEKPDSGKQTIRTFDFERLIHVAYQCTEFLDDILDHNQFPHPDITKQALTTRKLGLGVMGWADALALLHINYDSDEALTLGKKIMMIVRDSATNASIDMAERKGPFPGVWLHPEVNRPDIYEWVMKGESWLGYADTGMRGLDSIKNLGLWRRNATLTCIAPTGSISTLAGVSNGIEPHYSLEHTRKMGESTGGVIFTEHIGVLDRLNGFIPHTAHEIPWDWHIRHQAAFQEYTNLATSKTINMPSNVPPEDIFNAYVMAWNLGCKGITVYRDGSRDTQVLTTTKQDIVPKVLDPHVPQRRRLPDNVPSVRHKFRVGDTEGYVHFGHYEDGSPGEMFMTTARQGSTIDGMMDAFSILFSIARQYGVPIETIINQMRSRRFEPSGLTGNPDIPHATSIVDYLAQYLERNYMQDINSSRNPTGMICPDCGAAVIIEGGCLVCISHCGWTRC